MTLNLVKYGQSQGRWFLTFLPWKGWWPGSWGCLCPGRERKMWPPQEPWPFLKSKVNDVWKMLKWGKEHYRGFNWGSTSSTLSSAYPPQFTHLLKTGWGLDSGFTVRLIWNGCTFWTCLSQRKFDKSYLIIAENSTQINTMELACIPIIGRNLYKETARPFTFYFTIWSTIPSSLSRDG